MLFAIQDVHIHLYLRRIKIRVLNRQQADLNHFWDIKGIENRGCHGNHQSNALAFSDLDSSSLQLIA